MRKSRYMAINRLEFIVTYQCSGRCKHCSVGAKLNCSKNNRHVSADSAAEAIKQLVEIFHLSSVMTFGGESLLYADTVCAIHKAASQYGVDSRELITNGCFTKNSQQRRQTVKSLKEAGVNHLLLSVDAFHQETIPLEEVYDFARCAKEAGISNVSLSPAWVVNERHDNSYNGRTREIIAAFRDLGLPTAEGNNIFMTGNAPIHLSEYYSKPDMDLSDSCGSMPYTEPLDNVTSLTIDPNGDVMVCSFVIGNIYQQTMAEIVERYDPFQNEWMNSLISGRASGLLELSKSKGMNIDCAKCYSVCDLCNRVNKELMEKRSALLDKNP